MLEHWPDGTPKSRNNAFCWAEWELQADWGELITSSKARASQAARVDRERANGKTFTMVGMSQKSDERAALTRQNWHGEKVTKPHGGAYSKAKAGV